MSSFETSTSSVADNNINNNQSENLKFEVKLRDKKLSQEQQSNSPVEHHRPLGIIIEPVEDITAKVHNEEEEEEETKRNQSDSQTLPLKLVADCDRSDSGDFR